MDINMTTGSLIGGVISLIFGIIVAIFPKILNYLVAAFFIIAGIAGIIYALLI